MALKTPLERQYEDIVLAQEVKQALAMLKSQMPCTKLDEAININMDLGLDPGNIIGAVIQLYIKKNSNKPSQTKPQ